MRRNIRRQTGRGGIAVGRHVSAKILCGFGLTNCADIGIFAFDRHQGCFLIAVSSERLCHPGKKAKSRAKRMILAHLGLDGVAR